MRFALALVVIFAVLCLTTALDNNRRFKRATFDILYGRRAKRGLRANPNIELSKEPQLYAAKGEYVCGDKICKLEPGVIPKGCNGICQYPIDPMKYPQPKGRN